MDMMIMLYSIIYFVHYITDGAELPGCSRTGYATYSMSFLIFWNGHYCPCNSYISLSLLGRHEVEGLLSLHFVRSLSTQAQYAVVSEI